MPRTRIDSTFTADAIKSVTVWDRIPKIARGVEVGFTVEAHKVQVPFRDVLTIILDRSSPFGHPRPQ